MTHQEKINHVLNRFDFEKVHDQILKLGGSRFPNLIELKELARSNLEKLNTNEPSYILCGGFLATHFYGEISLYFTTEWSFTDDN